MSDVKVGGIGYFNAARGFGLLYVILGHSVVLFFDFAAKGIFSGAGRVMGGGIMAMYFMISGYSFFARSPRKCWKLQSRLLLKPYWITASAILLTKILLAIIKKRSFLQHGGELIMTYLLGFNALNGARIWKIPVNSISILWFLVSLFGGWILYNRIIRIEKRILRTGLIIGCVVIGERLTAISKIWPFCIPIVLLVVGYLAVGDYLRKNRILEKAIPWWMYLIGMVFVISSCIWGDIDIFACRWKLGLIDVATSFFLGFLFLKIYVWIMELLGNARILEGLEKVGMYSLWIICIHAYEKVIFPWYQFGMWFGNILGFILCVIMRCLILYLLSLMIQKISRRSRK